MVWEGQIPWLQFKTSAPEAEANDRVRSVC